MSRNYKFHNREGLYFISFATVHWIDVFIREKYMVILIDSIEYCQNHKGLQLFAYCIMPSHVHILFRSTKSDPSGFVRDFKRYTAKRLIEAISENDQESRREWILSMLKQAGKKKTNVSKMQFWQHHNKPIELWTNSVIDQKLDYIHQNPVVAGFVTEPEDWKYSSSRNFAGYDAVLCLNVL